MRLAAQAPVETRPLQADDVETPEPADDEVAVRISACAICRTDLHVVEGDPPLRRSPVVPGHQAVGRVERRGVQARRFEVGDRVGIAWLHRTCGRCRFCAGGRENLCEHPEFTGWTADGGYAELACVPEAFAYPIPPAFSDVEAAPLLCAGIIGYRALRQSGLAPGGRLAMYGFGSSAHVTLQVARARGIEVYVATRGPAARERALGLGAAWAGPIGAPMPGPVDGGIVFAPAGEIVPLALRDLHRGGTLALAGIHMSRIPALDYAALFAERTIRTVTANTRTGGEELLVEAARIPIRPVVSTFPLDAANDALLCLKRGELAGTGVLVIAS